jgi:hypothetical protein
MNGIHVWCLVVGLVGGYLLGRVWSAPAQMVGMP